MQTGMHARGVWYPQRGNSENDRDPKTFHVKRVEGIPVHQPGFEPGLSAWEAEVIAVRPLVLM